MLEKPVPCESLFYDLRLIPGEPGGRCPWARFAVTCTLPRWCFARTRPIGTASRRRWAPHWRTTPSERRLHQPGQFRPPPFRRLRPGHRFQRCPRRGDEADGV